MFLCRELRAVSVSIQDAGKRAPADSAQLTPATLRDWIRGDASTRLEDRRDSAATMRYTRSGDASFLFAIQSAKSLRSAKGELLALRPIISFRSKPAALATTWRTDKEFASLVILGRRRFRTPSSCEGGG